MNDLEDLLTIVALATAIILGVIGGVCITVACIEYFIQSLFA